MRRASAALFAFAALTVPASAFDPAASTPTALPRAGANLQPAAKIQDRIPQNNRAPQAAPQLSFFSLFQPHAPRAQTLPGAPALLVPQPAPASPYGWGAEMDAHIARHAAANGVPVELARRVVRRESNGNPRAVSKGNYGLMQIRLGTARAMGYTGNAQGLLDAETNMTYAMRYLSGALRAAKGNHDRAVALYARGYYYEAKAMGFSPYEAPRAAGLLPVAATR